MKNKLEFINDVTAEGNPSGGHVLGVGLAVHWQDGPLGREPDRKEPNGAFVEDLLEAARQRLVFYQTASGGRFHCEENAVAIRNITAALGALELRTQRREDAGAEGTYEGS